MVRGSFGWLVAEELIPSATCRTEIGGRAIRGLGPAGFVESSSWQSRGSLIPAGGASNLCAPTQTAPAALLGSARIDSWPFIGRFSSWVV
jgi:hypothetical protein